MKQHIEDVIDSCTDYLLELHKMGLPDEEKLDHTKRTLLDLKDQIANIIHAWVKQELQL